MSGRAGKSWWRFIAAGKGLSMRTGRYFGESMLVGAATGFVVVAFRMMIRFGDRLLLEGIGRRHELSRLVDGAAVGRMFSREALLDPHRLALLVLPAAGALLGYLLIRRFASVSNSRGTASAIHAYHFDGGKVPATVIPVKSLASVLTVGSGGSGGYEGPVTLLGAAVGSTIAQWLRLSVRARRILMAAGLAGGIAALFQAPLAGAIFGFEIFYSSSDIEYETVLPSFISSAVSYTVYACFFGWSPLFIMPPGCTFENAFYLLPFFVLAVAVVFGTRFYIRLFRRVERIFSSSTLSGWARVALGGLAVGAIGYIFPDVLGTSYQVIQASFAAGASELFEDYGALTAVGFICFFFMKAIATAFTVGSGGSAGVFAPAIVCGGTLGAAVGLLFAQVLPEAGSIHPAAFALVGMAGFLASAIRIPLTAIVMVSEISGNHSLLLPAMWVCGISFWLNNGWSLYRSQVHSRDSSPVHLYSLQ
ncbi:MAG: chloride channel protein [Kiritimatiellae bacterium]|nr:chloride channel protein [Kiritimatiellia bacterium]